MWLVIKIKNKCNLKMLEKDLKEVLNSNIKIFAPKIKIQKFKSNKFFFKDFYILGNYIIVNHFNFKNTQFLNKIKYLRGVHYILNTFSIYQNEIEQFVKRCRKNEDDNGYLIQNFFDLKKGKEIKFTSGPFVNFISELIDTQKNRICFLAGKYKILVQKNQNCISSG